MKDWFVAITAYFLILIIVALIAGVLYAVMGGAIHVLFGT